MMDPHALRVLEFYPVRSMMISEASTLYGRDELSRWDPCQDHDMMTLRKKGISEFCIFFEQKRSFPLPPLADIRPFIEDSRKRIPLLPQSLAEIARTLQVLKESSTLFKESRYFPRLERFASGLFHFPAHPSLLAALKRCLSADGEILDSASSVLLSIRKTEARVLEEIHRKLEEILHSPRTSRMVQEQIITQRHGRLVIPIKEVYRKQFKGILHDQSASGSTLFMEPLSVVDLNNRLAQIRVEEREEVDRILSELTALVARDADLLFQAIQNLAFLDALAAGARFSLAFHGVEPEVEKPEPSRRISRGLIMEGGRHPLLRARAVPVSLSLGEPRLPVGGSGSPDEGAGEESSARATLFRTLVITGPNTGGKTVTLKTVGLCCLLAQAGFHVPAARFVTPLFSEIFADIGDEQSISQNLSTFSSHLTTIVSFLPKAGPTTLVLLDELGAGTDPREGAALGIGILSYFHSSRAPTIATTHYPELKTFAETQPEMENASMEFDPHTLAPTFSISIGRPGRSLAFEVARRIGLPPPILEEATANLEKGEMNLEALLEKLEKETDLAKESRREHEELARELKQKGQALSQEMILAREARERADRWLLERKKAALEQLREEMEERREHLLSLPRQELEDLQEEVEKEAEEIEQRLARITPPDLSESEAAAKGIPPPASLIPLHPHEIARGLQVWSTSLKKEGTVLSPGQTGKVEIQIGTFKVRLPVEDLRKIEASALSEGKPGASTLSASHPDIPAQTSTSALPGEPDARLRHLQPLMVRGMTVEEALWALEKYLDDAIVVQEERVQIIHGKGHGILRRAIHEYLNGHPVVKSFHLAAQNEGGAGVTIAYLKEERDEGYSYPRG